MSKCYSCNNPAVAYCDGRGCDRPMCKRHIASSFSYHFRRPQKFGGSGWDSLDYCADCEANKKGGA